MIYFVRHGESIGNVEGIIQGSLDLGLTDKGMEQAGYLSKALKNKSIEQIISSPLLRASQTSEILNNEINTQIIFDDRLKEYCYGDAEGKPWEIATTKYGIQLGSWGLGDIKNEEEPHQFSKRIESFLNDIQDQYIDQNIICVTHGAVVSRIACSIMGLDISIRPHIRVSNTSVMLIDNKSSNFNSELIIMKINDCSHLGVVN